MKKKIVSILVCMVIALEIITSGIGTIDVYAAKVKYKNDTKDFQFAVPNGGWSTIRVYINYTENYIPKADSKNKYYRREIYYAYKTSYATTRPSFKLLNNICYKDKNGKVLHTFSKWTKCDAMADGSWEYFAAFRNGKNFTYKNTTTNKAVINYQTNCSGGIPSVQGRTISMRLNTK